MNSITIHANSPEYGTDLLLSRTGHHISRIKSSLELVFVYVPPLISQILDFIY